MKIFIATITSLLISGCSSIRIVHKDEFRLPEELFAECQQLEHAKDSTDVSLLENSKITLDLYSRCKSANHEKSVVLRKLQKALN